MRVPADCLLGQENAAFEYMTRELARERLAIALRAAASVEGMLDEAAQYTRDRKVFSRRVIDYQNTRFKLANARAQTTMLRVFLDDCLARQMEGELDPTTAAIAKLNATEIQGRVLDDLLADVWRLRLHGGIRHRPRLGRRARAAHLRRHQRSDAGDHRAQLQLTRVQTRASSQARISARASGVSSMTQGSIANATTRLAP